MYQTKDPSLSKTAQALKPSNWPKPVQTSKTHRSNKPQACLKQTQICNLLEHQTNNRFKPVSKPTEISNLQNHKNLIVCLPYQTNKNSTACHTKHPQKQVVHHQIPNKQNSNKSRHQINHNNNKHLRTKFLIKSPQNPKKREKSETITNTLRTKFITDST